MRRFLVFSVHGTLWALPIPGIREVLREITPRAVPRSPPGVAGVFALRGRILTLLDTEWLLSPGGPRTEVAEILLAGSCSAARLDPPYDHLALALPDEQEVLSETNSLLEPLEKEAAPMPWLAARLRERDRILHVLDPQELARYAQEQLITHIKLA